jgi:hypothetical protein
MFWILPIINAGGLQGLFVFPDLVGQYLIQSQLKPDVMPMFLVVCMRDPVLVLLKELVVDILLMELYQPIN